MAADAFNLLFGAFAMLGIQVSGRYNALHGLESALNLMVAMCDGALYAPTAAARLTKRRTPTPQWLLGKLRPVGRDSMERRARDMLDFTVQALRSDGMLRKPVTVAIDKTLIPYYGDRSDMTGRIYSKPDRGTKVFEAYATAQCVDGGCRAQLAARVVERGAFLAEIVENLLKDLARNRVRVRRLLVDREFFSVSVIRLLCKLGVMFVMPAVRTHGTAAAIAEHAAGVRNAVSKHVIKSASGEKVEVTLLIVKKKHAKKGEDEYLAFVTNLPRPSVAGLLDLPAEYRRRWGIETGYRDIKRIRPMTTSRSLSVRMAYFFFALAMYNAWIASRHRVRRDGARGVRLIMLVCLVAYGSRTVPPDRGKPG